MSFFNYKSKIVITRHKKNLLIKVKSIVISAFLRTIYKFTDVYWEKIFVSGSKELVKGRFGIVLVLNAASEQEIIQVLKEMKIYWRQIWWVQGVIQNLVSKIVLFIQCYLCDIWSCVVLQYNLVFLLNISGQIGNSFWCISSICWQYFCAIIVLLGF